MFKVQKHVFENVEMISSIILKNSKVVEKQNKKLMF